MSPRLALNLLCSQSDFELILLPLPSKCWNHRGRPLCLALGAVSPPPPAPPSIQNSAKHTVGAQ